MMNEEIASLLRESGYDREEWPIERHLEALRTAHHVPVLDLGMCAIRYEEAGPALRALLTAAAEGAQLSDEDATLLFRGLFIIGGARDAEAFAPLLRLLALPAEELDHLLGDLITESMAKIVAGTFDGDSAALFQAIADSDRDEFVRDALFGAATFLAWDGRIDREDLRIFLRYYYDERVAEDQDYGWVGWLNAIALLGMRDLEPLVRKAWDEGRIPQKVLYYSHFTGDLEAAERSPGDLGRFHDANLGYVDDVLVEMDWVRGGERPEEEADRWGDYEPHEPLELVGEPLLNPWRHVGRNDPCPCGSGRKAKKCCLGTEAAQGPIERLG